MIEETEEEFNKRINEQGFKTEPDIERWLAKPPFEYDLKPLAKLIKEKFK